MPKKTIKSRLISAKQQLNKYGKYTGYIGTYPGTKVTITQAHLYYSNKYEATINVDGVFSLQEFNSLEEAIRSIWGGK